MKRFFYMDILNILATFSVVVLHGSSFAFSNAGGSRWILAVIIQIFFIFAVPIFFMISGANNLDYRNRNDSKDFLIKRAKRVGIPFIFWSVIWFLYENFQYWHLSWWNLHTYSIAIDRMLHNSIQPIFWYFYFIIGFYLSVPLLSKITQKSNKNLVRYLIALNIIFVAIIGYYYQLRNQNDSAFANGLSIGVSGSIGIFIIGWYFKHFEITKRQRYLIYFLGISSMVTMLALTFVLSYKRGMFQRQVYSIWGLPGILWSLSIFIFFQQHFANWKPSIKVQNILKSFSSASLGVYVIHDFFIDVLEHNFGLQNSSYWFILVMPVVVWIMSVMVVKIIQLIPYLKRIV